MVNNRNGQGSLHQGKFTLFPDTHSEAYFGIMTTYVQENWTQEPTVRTFSRKKKMNVLFEDSREKSFYYLYNDFFMRTSNNTLFLSCLIKGLSIMVN